MNFKYYVSEKKFYQQLVSIKNSEEISMFQRS